MREMSPAASADSFSISEIARATARGSRASTRSVNEVGGIDTSGLFAQQAAGNHQPLNLARAFADRAELHVAKEFFRRVVLHESVAAMDLHAFFRRAHRDFARVQLRHGRCGR